jgi:hypothetical protein
VAVTVAVAMAVMVAVTVVVAMEVGGKVNCWLPKAFTIKTKVVLIS